MCVYIYIYMCIYIYIYICIYICVCVYIVFYYFSSMFSSFLAHPVRESLCKFMQQYVTLNNFDVT